MAILMLLCQKYLPWIPGISKATRTGAGTLTKIRFFLKYISGMAPGENRIRPGKTLPTQRAGEASVS